MFYIEHRADLCLLSVALNEHHSVNILTLVFAVYSHRRGANKDNFFVIRTAAVLHGGANKQNFPVIHTAAVRIRDLSQLFAPRCIKILLLFSNSSILFDNQKTFLFCISLLIIFFLYKQTHAFLILVLQPFYNYRLDVLQVDMKQIHTFDFFSLLMYQSQ